MAPERIKINQSLPEMIEVMTEGNIGAAHACMQLIEDGPRIDPDAWAKGLTYLLMLDHLNIWGSRIHTLWSDVCERDSTKTMALLASEQMGLAGTNKEAIDKAIEDVRQTGKHSLDLDTIYWAVKNQSPNFNPGF